MVAMYPVVLAVLFAQLHTAPLTTHTCDVSLQYGAYSHFIHAKYMLIDPLTFRPVPGYDNY